MCQETGDSILEIFYILKETLSFDLQKPTILCDFVLTTVYKP